MSEIVCIFLFNRLSEHLKSGLHQERSNTRVWVVPLPWQMAKACPGGSARAESTAEPPRDGAAWGSFPCPTPFLCVGSNAVALLACRGNKICSLVSSQHFCVWISWRNPLPLPKIFRMSKNVQSTQTGDHSGGWDPEQASAQARAQKIFHIPHVPPKQITDELNLLKGVQGHQQTWLKWGHSSI